MVGGGIISISESELPMAGQLQGPIQPGDQGLFPLASRGCRENVGDVQGVTGDSGAWCLS